jgi:hypothetical protein
MTRDNRGRFAKPHDTIPLCVRRAKSPPHVRGEATKRANWVALRNAATATLRRELGL